MAVRLGAARLVTVVFVIFVDVLTNMWIHFLCTLSLLYFFGIHERYSIIHVINRFEFEVYLLLSFFTFGRV